MTKTWTDQPDVLAETTIVAHVSLRDGLSAEVRKGPPPLGAPGWAWYVTVGSLFGSQTIECDSAETALRCIAVASLGRRGQALPTGARLMQGTGETIADRRGGA